MASRAIRGLSIGTQNHLKQMSASMTSLASIGKDRFMSLPIKEHNIFLGLIATSAGIMFICALATNSMISGKFINGATKRNFNAGFWKVSVEGSETLDLCSDWPSSSETVCDNVRAARAFCFVALFLAFGSLAGALVRVVDKRTTMPWKSVFALVGSGFCGMCSYSIWQGGVYDDLTELIQATFQNSIGERFWSTVGASYCLLLWGWLWSLIFIITKVMLPGIAFSFEG